MKLRLRSIETRQTEKLEVPSHCSLQQLRQILSQTLSSSSNSSPAPPDSIRLSLNKADEIQSSSPDEDTLQSLGIASGDLIFFTVSPSVTLIPKSQIPISIPAQNSQTGLNLVHEDRPEPSSTELQNHVAFTNENAGIDPKSLAEPSLVEPQTARTAEPSLPLQQDDQSASKKFIAQSEEESPENMDIDEDDSDDSAMEVVAKSFSVPGFLRKVFTEELGGDDGGGGRKHKLLVVAIHAVLLESGFVGFGMDSKNVVKGFQFSNCWPSNAFRLSLFYTLPEIIENATPSSEYYSRAFSLKFQNVGKYMNVYGSLGSGWATHSVRLNEDELVSFFNVVWANCGLNDDIVTSEGGILKTSPEKEVFKFWRTLKDNLALPLLIDLCEKVGFGLPPCFTRLPTELKLKILELLPGVEVAKLSCVSSELRYLASDDDIWRQKCVEQFGDTGKSDERISPWKEKFARSWKRRKRRRLSSTSNRPPRLIYPRHLYPPRRYPPFLMFGRYPPATQRQGIRFQSSNQFPSFGNI